MLTLEVVLYGVKAKAWLLYQKGKVFLHQVTDDIKVARSERSSFPYQNLEQEAPFYINKAKQILKFNVLVLKFNVFSSHILHITLYTLFFYVFIPQSL